MEILIRNYTMFLSNKYCILCISKIVGFHRPGSIRILSSPERVNEAKYMRSRQAWHNAYMKMLNPDEVHEMVPYMNMDNVYGGLFTPGKIQLLNSFSFNFWAQLTQLLLGCFIILLYTFEI